MTNVLDDLGAGLKSLASRVIQDEIEVTLTITDLLVFKAIRELMKAWRQEQNFLSKNAELACISGLGVCAAWNTNNTNPIPSPEYVVMLGKSSGVIGVLREALGFAEDLDRSAFALAVVETKRIASGSDGYDANCHAYLDIFEGFAFLQVLVLFQELADRRVDVELVRVGVGVLALPKRIDMS